MDDSKPLQRSLILAVVHLCSRTREFAEGEARHPLTLAPVRESVDMILRTIEALETLWDPSAPEPAGDDPAEASWLFEPSDEGR
jgi:hypothetical protein